MDKCSAELITLIFEEACASDLGKTARSLALVSKGFRAFAEPLEFCALAISGRVQLEKTFSRLKKVQEDSGRAEVDVRHLFVCEFKPGTQETVEADMLLHAKRRIEFWESVAALVRSISMTLITFSVMQCSPPSEKHLMCFLSGMYLPHLKVLVLKQSTFGGSSHTACDDSNFIPPLLPSLRRLHINALLYDKSSVWPYLHPLLVDMHSRFHTLTHLVVCGPRLQINDIGMVIKIICGCIDDAAEPVLTCTANRRLPGNLVSAIIHQHTTIENNDLSSRYMAIARSFINAVDALSIDGLQVRSLSPVEFISLESFEGGEWWGYKELLSEWMEQALEH
ncbi:hypothetical protein M0805_009744 [Coniferiporia weirii]|nr:hypothetical protein M0805_009744 [Coniferiporia weirii]